MNFIQRFMVFFLVPPLLAAAAGEAGKPDANRVVVRGRRPDQMRLEYPGSGLRFFPNGSSQDDLSTHMKRQAAFDVVPAERPSPFGFALPRVRGQDARFTQLFIDDLPLADPYAALPLIEEIDLPAFDSVETSSGVAPYELPAISLRGAMRFQLFDDEPSSTESDCAENLTGKLGIRVSSPVATTSWSRFDFTKNDVKSRLYFRQLNSKGNYRYYDDNGTPLNHDDDEVIQRGNNHRASQFVMPAFWWRRGAATLKAFGVWNAAQQGLPSLIQASKSNSASQTNALGLGRISVAWDLGSNNSMNAAVGMISDHRTVNDPGGSILVVRDHDDRRIITRSGEMGWRGACVGGVVLCRVLIRSDQSVISPQGLSRGVVHVISAIRTVAPESTLGLIEAKADVAKYSGGVSGQVQPSWSVGWKLPAMFSFESYVQLATEVRPPSLLESEGDGARIISSPSLAAEKTTHLELGLDQKSSEDDRAIHLALFRDDRRDAIVIVPSSISSYRAVNIPDTSSIIGVELAAEKSLEILNVGALRGSASWISFQSRTGQDNLLIPGVPSDQGAISISQPLFRRAWRPVVARWTSRRRGVVYRDVANNIRLPPWWIHDAAFDIRWRCEIEGLCSRPVNFDIGLAVNNLADTMATSYSTSSGQHGKTGYSDVWGVPLPGRTWTMSLTSNF